MNSSNNNQALKSDGSRPNYPMNRIAYGIGFAVGVLLIITVFTLISYLCINIFTIIAYFCSRGLRTRSHPQEQEHEYAGELPNRLAVVGGGLDDSTLLDYPTSTYIYAQVVLHASPPESMISGCCSICLADYADSDVLRLLPDCGHAFHLKCVDPWLKLHASCPICRATANLASLMPASSQVAVVPSSGTI